uniref:Phosphatidylinositol N-acetylglucosaminyltransferase subunit C n=1 Tax=Lygus hesperus TaxID=30085 RepID=A0A0A9YYH5_LYGHE
MSNIDQPSGFKTSWKKNLYENQGYPDNYTDISFLEELKKNVNMRKVPFTEAFLGSTLVTQQLCVIVLFTLNFYCIYDEKISSEVLFLVNCCFTVFGYALYGLFYSVAIKRHTKALISFLILGYLLSPVLKTLTESISTDTIYAMSSFMMIVHLVFYDYGVKAVIVSSSLSLNAAVFACLCLASRLQTPFDSFVLMSFAVQCFLLCPLVLAKIKNNHLILVILLGLCIFGLFKVSHIMTVLFVGAVVFLNLLCPFLFVRWHAYKDNIYGPWDEAVVKGFEWDSKYT